MRPQDIKENEFYRFKEHPNYSWAKVLAKLRPKEERRTQWGLLKNTKNKIVLYCEHTIGKGDTSGRRRYFLPNELVKA